jgi:hypothetical protein
LEPSKFNLANHPYLVIAIFCFLAGYCFVNSYYGFRHPEKYLDANWTIKTTRGLPKDYGAVEAVEVSRASSLLMGAIFLGLGLFMLHGLRTGGG